MMSNTMITAIPVYVATPSIINIPSPVLTDVISSIVKISVQSMVQTVTASSQSILITSDLPILTTIDLPPTPTPTVVLPLPEIVAVHETLNYEEDGDPIPLLVDINNVMLVQR